MRHWERKAYLERMGDDFTKTVVSVAREYDLELEELFHQRGNRPFWHAVTTALNETNDFEWACRELNDLTESKLKELIGRNKRAIKGEWQELEGDK